LISSTAVSSLSEPVTMMNGVSGAISRVRRRAVIPSKLGML
jgi:hypothetical protein